MGKVEWVQPKEVESTLVSILKSIQSAVITGSASLKQESSELPTLTLVGFDLYLEFRILSTEYPRLLTECFTSWVDLQEIAKDLFIGLGKRVPVLTDTLIAFGFKPDLLAIVSKATQHSAGTDTIRMTALLVNLLAFPLDKNLSIELTPRRKWSRGSMGNRYRNDEKFFLDSRPSPWEFFPFTARARRIGGPVTKATPEDINEIFSEYNPTAVGNKGLGLSSQS